MLPLLCPFVNAPLAMGAPQLIVVGGTLALSSGNDESKSECQSDLHCIMQSLLKQAKTAL